MSLSTGHKADLLLVLVTLLAAVSWIFSREAVLLMPPLLFMALRFLLAGSLLAFIGRQQLRALSAAGYLRSLKAGLVFGVGMASWVMGLFLGHHLGEGAFLTSLGVVLVPVLARLFFRETQPRATWVALPMATAGLALLSLRHGFRPELGQIFYVSAATIFALYYSLSTRVATGAPFVAQAMAEPPAPVPPLPLTALVLLMVGGVAAGLSFALEPWSKTLTNFSAEMAGWILLSAVIGTAARFLIQTYAQSLSTNTHGVVIMVVEPVWVALLAAGWFGETMTAIQLLGCGLIFTALLVNRHEALRRWLAAWY